MLLKFKPVSIILVWYFHLLRFHSLALRSNDSQMFLYVFTPQFYISTSSARFFNKKIFLSFQFGASLEWIRINNGNSLLIPPIMLACTDFLSTPDCLETEGIFRRSANAALVKELQVNNLDRFCILFVRPDRFVADLVVLYLTVLCLCFVVSATYSINVILGSATYTLFWMLWHLQFFRAKFANLVCIVNKLGRNSLLWASYDDCCKWRCAINIINQYDH